MENIVIIGARFDGHAKVVLEILQAEGKYNMKGFIDDNINRKDEELRGFKILGTTNDIPNIIQEFDIQGAIIAIGNNKIRRQLALIAKSYGLTIINTIHPTAIIDSDVVLGEGNVISQSAIIITGTKLNNYINIHAGVTIDHDNVIEDGANLAPGVHTAGRVIVKQDAFIGIGAVVIPDITIGEGSVVGAGSAVISDVEPYVLVVGVPAKFKKNIYKPENLN